MPSSFIQLLGQNKYGKKVKPGLFLPYSYPSVGAKRVLVLFLIILYNFYVKDQTLVSDLFLRFLNRNHS
ncbi:hypothetical protein CYJ36_08580 [Bacillus sp. UMB0893]|nr:hypothetical protein CYJ36_08580 [Bacillus sp. UMB0893]